MTSTDRNYVLNALVDIHHTENRRADFYTSKQYPAMTLIAEDRAYSIALLIDAVNGGLLEDLHDKAQQLVLADAAHADAEVEHVDYAEAAAVREIEREMAVEAGDDSELDRQIAKDDARNERNFEHRASHGMHGAWEDPAVRRAVREVVRDAESGAV